MSHECWRNMYGLYCGVWCDIPFPAVSKACAGPSWPNLCGAWYHLGSVLSSTHRDVTFSMSKKKLENLHVNQNHINNCYIMYNMYYCGILIIFIAACLAKK